MTGPGARRASSLTPVRGVLLLSLVGAACLVSAAALRCQEVSFTPRKGEALDHRLASFIERAGWSLWMRDTAVAADGVVPGNLLILSSVARLAGRVEGDVYVVDGDLFLRPGASIEGDVVVLGGGYYGSGLASVGGEVVWRPSERFVVLPSAGGYEIHSVEEPVPWVELHGLDGLDAPTYDRVSAVTVAWGLTLRASTWKWRPTLEAVARFRTGQGEFEGTVRQFWHPGSLEFGVEVERATLSHDAWARGGTSNSISYLFGTDDFRDYYQADRAALVVRAAGDGGWTPEIRLGREDAKTRRAGGHWTILDSDEVRPNAAVEDGETWSASLGVSVNRATGDRSRVVGQARLEAADSTVAGDFSYVLGEIRARWTTPGFRSHDVEVFALVRGDVSGSLPRQRWTGFGGAATLPTFGIMSFRGSRVAYGHLRYAVPIESLDAGPLGVPSVFGRVSSGAAWQPGESADFRTNLVAGIAFWLLEGGVAADPGTDGEARAYVVLRFPGDL